MALTARQYGNDQNNASSLRSGRSCRVLHTHIGFFMVAVEQLRVNVFLAAIACMLDMSFMLVGGVGLPFVCKQGLSVLWRISHQRNNGDRVFEKVIDARWQAEAMVSILNGVDVGNVVKQLTKLHTASTQNTNIRVTVRDDLGDDDEVK